MKDLVNIDHNPIDSNLKKVEYFEDLNIYQKACDLTKRIYEITKNNRFSKDKGLVNQIRRASVSIMSNIAEGFERGSNKEFIQFLYIAKGSCGEVRAQLTVAFDQNYLEKSNYEELVNQSRQVNGMTYNLINYLSKSNYKGTKSKGNNK